MNRTIIIITFALLVSLCACKRVEFTPAQGDTLVVQPEASATIPASAETQAAASPEKTAESLEKADTKAIEPTEPPELKIKCMEEPDALALCKSGKLPQFIYDQSCNRTIWHLPENCPDTEEWIEEEHYHNGEYDEPPEWRHEDCALVDEKGEFVTGFQYWDIEPIHIETADGHEKVLYSFVNARGDYGLLDAYGKEIVPPQFHRIKSRNGYIIATVFKPDDSCIFEELNGRKVYDHAPVYQYCHDEDGEHSVLSPDGRLIVDYRRVRNWFNNRHPDLSVGREFVEFTDNSINYRIESSFLMIPKLLKKGYFNYFSVRTGLKCDYNGVIQTDFVVYEGLYTSSYGDEYLKDISKSNANMVLKLYPNTTIIAAIISINEKERFITVTYSLQYDSNPGKLLQHSLYFDFELNPINDLDNHKTTIQKQREQ